MKEEKEPKDLLCLKAGTATSSPTEKTASQSINIVNVMLWMKRNAYEESTIKKTAKILRHLQRNCNTAEPEAVKLYIANKTCSNGRKQNLVEAYDKHMDTDSLRNRRRNQTSHPRRLHPSVPSKRKNIL